MSTKMSLRALPGDPDDDLETVPRLLPYETVATRLGCGRTRVYELVREGELTMVRIGKTPMVLASSVAELIDRRVAAVTRKPEKRRRGRKARVETGESPFGSGVEAAK